MGSEYAKTWQPGDLVIAPADIQPGDLGPIREARKIYPASDEHLRYLCRAGIVPAVLVKSPGSRRGRWLIHLPSLRAYLAGELNRTPPPPSNAVTLDELADQARRNA